MGLFICQAQLALTHGIAQGPVILWLDYYAEKTRGVQVMANATDDPRLEKRAATRCVTSRSA